MDFTKSYLVAALIKKLKVLGAKLRPFNATHNANDSHKQLALPKPLKIRLSNAINQPTTLFADAMENLYLTYDKAINYFNANIFKQ